MSEMSHRYSLYGGGSLSRRKEKYFWYVLKVLGFFAFNFLIHDVFALLMIIFALLTNDVVHTR